MTERSEIPACDLDVCPTEGSIKIDGVDIRHYSAHELRGHLHTNAKWGQGGDMLPAVMLRTPWLNGKITFGSRTLTNPIGLRLVQPVVANSANGYRFTLADSTGGSILAAAGGRLSRGSAVIDIPKKGVWTLEQVESWMEAAGRQIPKFLDPKASLREQAATAMQLSNAIVVAGRNALRDQNMAARLNFSLQPSTYNKLKAELGQNASGSELYNRIIAKAQEQAKTLGCFVAGTLVHTQEGLRPIEQIKVGDYVLAKPEDGSGAKSYKRVTRTYGLGEREVYFLCWWTPESVQKFEAASFAVATGNHPIWVDCIVDEDEKTRESIHGWLDVNTIWKRTRVSAQDQGCAPFNAQVRLASGARATLYSVPVLASKDDRVGLTFDDFGSWQEQLDGVAVRFGDRAEVSFTRRSYGLSMDTMQMNAEPLADYEGVDPDSVEFRSFGYRQLKRPVFNIEVEDDHTYFVGESGLWVHNRSGEALPSVGPRQRRLSESWLEKNPLSDWSKS